MRTKTREKYQVASHHLRTLLSALPVKYAVRHLFFVDPYTGFSLSEVAEFTKTSKSSVSAAIRELEKEKLITIVKKRYVLRIQADIESFAYKKSKIVSNLEFLYETGIVEHLIEKYAHPKAIVLFGSFRKGEDAAGSDIDIAVETESVQKSLDKEIVADIENFLDRSVNILVFTRKTISSELFSNIANGIVLYGYLEARP